ncbi:MAG: SIMPL domain-containing protein [Clostridiales bacterium]|nr:SIMPL domain-containing protein [Clostridiales bacterium]
MDNKKMLYGLIGVLALVCIAALIGVLTTRGTVSASPGTGTTEADKEVDTLKVTGLGKVSIKPDIAYLNVGVRTINKDAKVAQEENKKIMEKVMTKLKALKIEEKDIQTSAYNIWPRYNYYDNKETLEGYEVENMVTVTLRKVESVGDVLDGISEAGANMSYGISFGIEDTETAYKDALEKAIEDAKGKAETMSNKAGVSIIRLLNMVEGTTPDYYPRAPGNYDMAMEAEQSRSVPIAVGELEIQANVTVFYQIK